MAHEMLNALYPLSPAYKNSDQFNKAWENLKTTGNKDVRQQLQDVDTHLKRLGYDKLGTDAMNSSRFSYLAHDALTQGSSWIPKQLMPYYKGIVVPKSNGGIQDLGTSVLDAYKNNPEDEPHDRSFQRNKPWSAPGPYVTSLSPKDETEFQKWAKANPKLVEGELNTDTPDYDVRGRWLADKHGDPEAKLTRSEFDGTLHASDKWKTPYDAVFSRESKYATPDAPRWVGDKLIASNGQVIVDETPPKKK